MSEDNNPQSSSTPPSDNGQVNPVQPPSSVVSQEVLPPLDTPSKSHTALRVYLVGSLIILTLNTGLLSLSLIPFIGIYIAIGAAPILLITGLLGLANLFIVSRVLSKKYFTNGFRKVATTVLTLSVVAVLGGASSPFILAEQSKQNARTQEKQNEANSYYSEVSVEKATELLNNCKIYNFNYSNPKGSDWEKTPETTSSGILIYDEYSYFGKPSNSNWYYARDKYIMYIADKQISTIVPIARQVQQTCDIQFRHDNVDEQEKDGHWYFRDELVN